MQGKVPFGWSNPIYTLEKIQHLLVKLWLEKRQKSTIQRPTLLDTESNNVGIRQPVHLIRCLQRKIHNDIQKNYKALLKHILFIMTEIWFSPFNNV